MGPRGAMSVTDRWRRRCGAFWVAAALAVGCGSVHRDPLVGLNRDKDAGAPAADAGLDAGSPDGLVGADAGDADDLAGSPSPLSGAWAQCGRLGNGGASSVAMTADFERTATANRFGRTVTLYQRWIKDSTFDVPWPVNHPHVVIAGQGAAVAVKAAPADVESRLGVWRTSDRKQLLDLDHVSGVPALDAGGDQLVVIVNHVAQLYQVSDGKMIRDLGPAIAAAFGPGQDQIALYDAAPGRTGSLRVVTGGIAAPPRALAIGPRAWLSPRGTFIVGLGLDEIAGLSIYRVADGQKLPATLASNSRTRVAFSNDDGFLLIFGSNQLSMFDLVTGMDRELPGRLQNVGLDIEDAAVVGRLGFEGVDGTVLAAGEWGIKTIGIDPTPEGRYWEGDFATSSPIVSIAASPDGRWIGTGAYGVLVLWYLPSRTAQVLQAGFVGTGFAFASDSGRIAYADGGSMSEYTLSIDAPVWVPANGGSLAADPNSWQAAYAPDVNLTAVTHVKGPVVLFRRGGNNIIRIGTTNPQLGVAFTPDGKYLATSEPSLWRVPAPGAVSPEPPATFDVEKIWSMPEPVLGPKFVNYTENWVALSPDGGQMVVSRFTRWQSIPWGALSLDMDNYETSVKIRRTSDGTLIKDFGSLRRRPVFSPDGRWIVAGDEVHEVAGDRVVKLARDPDLVAAGIDPHLSAVSTFLPDGRIALGDAYGMIQLYCPQ
jgi:hypothetical protein